MKRLLFQTVMSILVMNVFGQNESGNTITFEYPFNRQDTEWKTFTTSRERIAALQMPAEKLKRIGTTELLDVCLNFPYLPDIFAFDHIEKGIDNLKSRFNGFDELLRRQDLTRVLVEKFEVMSASHYEPSVASGVDCLFNNAKLAILRCLVTGNTLSQFCESQLDSRRVTTDGDTIYGYRMKYVYTPLLTPVLAGSWIYSDYPLSDKNSIAQYVESSYDVTVVSEATRKYNCHGYAWHMSDGYASDSVWIGVDNEFDENNYWEDDSYIEVSSGTTSGIRVAYDESTANHSAVVYDASHYISKWGPWPLVIHDPNEVPYDVTQPKKFFRKRVFEIIGNDVLCGSNTYYVSDLPSSATVAWSISGTTPSSLTLTQNSPSANQCTITRSGYAEFSYITLCANIMRNGVTLRTVTKKIYRDNFSGTYEEQGSSYNGHDYPAISQTNITNRSATYVYINGIVTLYSDYFRNKELTTSGPYTYFSHLPGNRVRFSLSSANLSQPFTITVPASGCDDEVRLTFRAHTPYLGLSLNITPVGKRSYEVSLNTSSVDVDNEETSGASVESQQGQDADTQVNLSWNLEVTHATTGRKAASISLKEPTYLLDATGWETGIYVVRAQVGEESLTGKITVK